MSDPIIHHPFSPSTLQRLSLCPGSWRMSKDIPEPPKSEDAAEGTMLHEAVAKTNLDGLTAEQESAVIDCLAIRESVTLDGDKTLSEYKVTVQNEAAEELTSGYIDYAAIHSDKTADIVDWKFGRTPVPEANRNFQLAAYALGVMQTFGVTSVTAHIVQPRIAQHTYYTFANPAAILHNLETIIGKAKSETLILSASDEACRYCRAASTCPACNQRYGLVPADIRENMLTDPTTLLNLWERAQVAQKLVDQIKQAVTDYINEHGSLGDWTIEQRAGRREVSDTAALYERVSQFLSGHELAECYSVKVSSVLDKLAEKIIKSAAANDVKVLKKDAKKQAEEMIEDLLVRGQGSAVLTRGGRQ